MSYHTNKIVLIDWYLQAGRCTYLLNIQTSKKNKDYKTKTNINKLKQKTTKQNKIIFNEDFLLVDKGLPDFRPPENVLESLSNAAIGENYMLNHYSRAYVSNIIICYL